jgi:protoheme IX farnesyltransferase
MAIAWIYREDYDRAGYLVLPGGNVRARVVAWQSLLPSILLIPLCVVPTLLGHAGLFYVAGASLLSFGFLYYGARLALHRSNIVARQLLTASVVYLPCLFLLMLFNKK